MNINIEMLEIEFFLEKLAEYKCFLYSRAGAIDQYLLKSKRTLTRD